MGILTNLVSSIIQVIIFSIIPFIWWLVSNRNESSFLEWIGIKKITIQNKKKYVMTFGFILILLVFSSLLIIPFFINSSDMATSQFINQGIVALIPALIYAFIQTGLSEEILFRGFLAKRLINKFGFLIGNIVQSVLFGALHVLLFISLTNWLGTIIIFIITGFTGWLMGIINEKQSGGSIISSWLIHGCANTLAAIFAMFNIV
ncbi:MAG: CPBP family intramembrane glutamic endopeptidase [Candidatus Izemoplasmatales bacterium]